MILGMDRGRTNTVQDWKAEYKLKYCFNCPYSPDLSLIENSWQMPQKSVGWKTYWDDKTAIAAIERVGKTHIGKY